MVFAVRPAACSVPYPNAAVVKDVLQHLQRVFQIRNCRDAFFAHRSRPCLQHQIGRCSAPCVGLISSGDYARDLQAAVRVLEGRSDELSSELRAEMSAASEARRFEAAALIRDQLAGLQEMQAQQIATAPRSRDVDVIAIVGEPGQYAIALLTVRDGQSLGTQNVFPAALAEPSDALVQFVLLHYGLQTVPAEILVNQTLPDRDAVTAALAAIAGRTVQLRQPERGLPGRWLELAEDNAREALRMHSNRGDMIRSALRAWPKCCRCQRRRSASSASTSVTRAGRARSLAAWCLALMAISSATIDALTSRELPQAMTTPRLPRRSPATARISSAASGRDLIC